MSPKRALRRIVKEKRDSLVPDERERRAVAIKEKLFALPEFKQARSVLFFAAFGSEVPTLGMMRESIRLGKEVILPITNIDAKTLTLRRVDDLEGLRVNKYGIPEPIPGNTTHIEPGHIDLVIVPGMAFDRCGQRIGYGGGYYDRFLSGISPSIPRVSIAFEVQIVQELPSEEHDLPVDKVVTEERIIDACKNRDQMDGVS